MADGRKPLTSTNAPEVPSFLDATPEQVETGIAREIRKHLPVLDPRDTAAIAMVPVRPVLEAKDAEIGRLRRLVAPGADEATMEMFARVAIDSALDELPEPDSQFERDRWRTVSRAAYFACAPLIRTAERKRIAAEFRAKGMYAAANEIDPLGPLDGARAAGGTT